MIIGAATAKETVPVAAATVCRIPIAADELCRMDARSIPRRRPTMGFEKVVNSLLKPSDEERGASAFSMVVIPKNRMPNAMTQDAILLAFFFLLISMMKAETPIRRGANEEGLSKLRSVLPEPEISPRRRI